MFVSFWERKSECLFVYERESEREKFYENSSNSLRFEDLRIRILRFTYKEGKKCVYNNIWGK